MSADLIAAMAANETSEQPSALRCLEGIRLALRQGQLELMANPDPTSPWWFLVDPHAEFTT